ncbi:response regulator transcription factor [Isoptericola sp. 4D.3]|uniref:Response regulator transcription factor n=1 Tax=Isoptericola peretonis TaxID=2918523 RepID=A0ABT0J104_9MICO|nr:response regulator transcription factor [Isoptericola sp. 4D.3]
MTRATTAATTAGTTAGTDARTVRVAVVDDDPRVRQTLREILASDASVTVVGEAGDGSEALALLDRWATEVVVLDVRMPVLDGIATLRRLRARRDTPRVLILTSFGESEYVRDAIELGVDGFLLKSGDPRDLLRAVHGSSDGETYLSPGVAHMAAAELRRGLARRQAGADAARRLGVLTRRERDVVEALAGGATNAEIARRLHLAESTVKAYVSAAIDRAGVRNRVELAWLLWLAAAAED